MMCLRINEKRIDVFLFFSLLLFFSCSPKKNISAKSIVEKGIKFHDDSNNWKNLKTLSFNKKVILFLEDGSVESEVNQHQEFVFYPELSGKISWKRGVDSISIVYKNGKLKKFINKIPTLSLKELKSAENTFFASQYVIRQPFDLLEKNIKLIYSGIKQLKENKAHEIKVTYDEDKEKSDQWFYYFDVNTFKVVANKIIRSDHISLVNNITFNSKTDFIFNENRKSYRLNEQGEKTYLRAEYFYSNYKTSY
ncbi:DUF6503 family protein [uncultured Polaribacter sp.]|uniref:DUF6503 family protein n=1 Tax=uncultured Polaribacter sp. TaxID=174711 RepID=UPI002632588D|nr:DUF6503 family protein [uncultured Polaribacter sp.]